MKTTTLLAIASVMGYEKPRLAVGKHSLVLDKHEGTKENARRLRQIERKRAKAERKEK